MAGGTRTGDGALTWAARLLLAVVGVGISVGIGIGLMTRGLIERRPRVTVKKAAKQAKRAAKDARREVKAAARA